MLVSMQQKNIYVNMFIFYWLGWMFTKETFWWRDSIDWYYV